MKITAVKTQIVELPADDPLGNSPVAPGTKRPFVTVSVETDQGIEGIAVTFFGGLLTKALRQAIDALGALALGEDPLRHEAVMRKLQDVSGHAGPGGVLTLAQSTLDIALWDIKGKAFETPLWKLLGGARERVPTYASGALMRSLTLDQAVASAQRLVKSGFREVKMQLALPGVA